MAVGAFKAIFVTIQPTLGGSRVLGRQERTATGWMHTMRAWWDPGDRGGSDVRRAAGGTVRWGRPARSRWRFRWN